MLCCFLREEFCGCGPSVGSDGYYDWELYGPYDLILIGGWQRARKKLEFQIDCKRWITVNSGRRCVSGGGN
tara:strand:+ start:317 stop:529 length:213 start_codon:yes stop_codon:yes gene_type:complete